MGGDRPLVELADDGSKKKPVYFVTPKAYRVSLYLRVTMMRIQRHLAIHTCIQISIE